MGTENKERKLKGILKGYGSAVVAFSGGVDSSFLTAAAQAALGDKMVAVTVVTPLLPSAERDWARRMARDLGVKHRLRKLALPAKVLRNAPERCYDCKKEIFSWLLKYARANGYAAVMEGSNRDDLKEDRPGKRALKELGIASPLLEAGLTKTDIRRLSKRAGLATWDKPSCSCLATRLPFGEKIAPGRLKIVETAERYLHSLGLGQVRVRLHGDIGRIEVMPEQRLAALRQSAAITRRMRTLGVAYVCLDLEGYRSGSMNRMSWKRKKS